jgi:cold-inducible RNA-binding protein
MSWTGLTGPVEMCMLETMEDGVATRLYVGNLPYGVDEDKLKELFGEVGEVVSVSLPTDRDTGQRRGFGFVEMANQSEAEDAIKKYDGFSLDNRQLRVNIAREREERPRGGGGGGYGGGRYASGR